MSNVDIYAILASKPHNSYFLSHYYKFILACCQENSLKTKEELGYTEKHHICPKAKDMFPEYKSFKEHPWNKISLTADQHFTAHRLLWKAYGGSQSQAFYKMQHKVEKNREYPTKTISATEYKILREDAVKSQSGKRILTEKQHQEASLRTRGENNGMYGKTHTEEARLKISKGHTGKKHPHRYGMNAFRNNEGNTIFCKVDDPRVASGEYKGVTFGKSNYFDANGKTIQLYTDDPRVISGEVKNIHKDKIVSDETKELLRKINLGRKASDETKKKLSKAKKGIPKSKEHIDKIVETKMKERRLNDVELHYFKNLKTGECIHCSRSTLEDRIGFTLYPLFGRIPPYKQCKNWCLISRDEFAEFVNCTEIISSIP